MKAKMPINFWPKMWGCIILNAEEKSAKRIRAWDCGSSKCLYNLFKGNSFGTFDTHFCPKGYWLIHASENEWLHKSFITSDVRATRRKSLSYFGVDLLGTGTFSKENVGLEDLSKNATELHTKLQSYAIIRAHQGMVHQGPNTCSR